MSIATGCKVLSLLDTVDDILVQPFMPDRAVVALDVGVLLRLARLDMRQGDALFLSPFQQCMTDVFRMKRQGLTRDKVVVVLSECRHEVKKCH